jgi:hypothetical protein
MQHLKSRIVTVARHHRFEMLFEIFRRNPVPLKVNDKGPCMPLTRSRCEAVPLDSSFGLQSVVKPHFRGNCDVWWGSIDLGSLFCEPPRRSSGKLTGVSETQSSLGILTPRQEFPGGGESTEVAVAVDNRDDRSVLKLWDNDRRCVWGSPRSSLEHHRG